MFRSSNFDKSIESATSHLHLEPDWQSILVICDSIRQNDVTPKYALGVLKKKMFSTNPHSAYYALLVVESMVKNCGPPVHEEISSKTSCEMFTQLINTTQHENVKNKMLELIQTWAFAFRANHKYRAIKDTMNILKCEGHKFPELKESDVAVQLFASDVAPEWADGEVCHRCRVQFSFTQRKHHCRNCGQVFCAQCSNKTSTLPKFGIEKEVRVCEGCYINLQQKPAAVSGGAGGKKEKDEDDLPAEYLASSLAQQSQAPPSRSEQEIQEEEELQLALALSQSEAEEQQKKRLQTYIPRSFPTKSPSPDRQRSPSPPPENTDPELSKYLNRSYWEQRNQQKDSPASPSAPTPTSSIASFAVKSTPSDAELDDFVHLMKNQVEIFVNRMKSNSARGRNIAMDTSIQALFLNLSGMHSKLLNYIKEMDDKRMMYEQLQDKLGQVRDSRAALDVLRQEHQEKLRRIAEEQERQRQIQMAQKLEIMRKKKQEYLQYQRQLALQRIQEQEREMQLRQEQQKAQAQMRMSGAFNPYLPPGQGPVPPMANYAPAPYGYQPQMFPPGMAPPFMMAPPGHPMMPPQMMQMPGQQQQQGGPIEQQQPGPGGPPSLQQQPISQGQQVAPPPQMSQAPPHSQQQQQPPPMSPPQQQQQQPVAPQPQPIPQQQPVSQAPPPAPAAVQEKPSEVETAELISFD